MTIDPTLIIFNNHIEAAVFFGWLLVYISTLAIFGHRSSNTKDEKLTAFIFLLVFGTMAAVSLGLVACFAWVI